MKYVFMSFASHHTGKNIGCCVIQVDNLNNANEKCKELGLMPNECNNARGYVLNEQQFNQQGMELNKFYTRQQMSDMGFQLG